MRARARCSLRSGRRASSSSHFSGHAKLAGSGADAVTFTCHAADARSVWAAAASLAPVRRAVSRCLRVRCDAPRRRRDQRAGRASPLRERRRLRVCRIRDRCWNGGAVASRLERYWFDEHRDRIAAGKRNNIEPVMGDWPTWCNQVALRGHVSAAMERSGHGRRSSRITTPPAR